MVSVINAAFEDPAHVSSATFTDTSAAKPNHVRPGAFAGEEGWAGLPRYAGRAARSSDCQQGECLAPRGNPSDCALASTSDPFVEYNVDTGKVVPQPTPNVPPPYAQTAKLFKINGAWQMTSYTTDATKTCSP